MLRLIGENPVAGVFLARERKPERLVALKVLKADFAADAEMRARFEREAIATAQIVHPNVAAIYRVGQRKDGVPYIAQEYLGGSTLADVLHSSEIRTADEPARTIASIAKALAAAAAKGIVHGNVRPDNVVIEQDSGRVVLTNFGIAGVQEAKHVDKLTPADEGLSGARYGSPEQLRGETATKASDIFSLGVLANELLTDHIPVEVALLLQRCVDINPDARPSAEELVRQLANDELTEGPPDSMRLAQRAVEFSLMRAAVIGGVVIMAIGAAVAFWLYDHYSQ